MSVLVLEAYWKLIHFDLDLARGSFSTLYNKVRNYPIRKCTPKLHDVELINLINRAVDMASIWYWKEVKCLQRSAATACLMKKCGIPAEMVIGVQQLPFRCHAWVEVDGQVVNDKPYMAEIYRVLDRC